MQKISNKSEQKSHSKKEFSIFSASHSKLSTGSKSIAMEDQQSKMHSVTYASYKKIVPSDLGEDEWAEIARF